jgi:hypothetical protein
MQSIKFDGVRVRDRAGGRQEDEYAIELLFIIGQRIDFAIQRLGIKGKSHVMRGLPESNGTVCTKADQKKTKHESHLKYHFLHAETRDASIPFGMPMWVSISTGIHRVKHLQECTSKQHARSDGRRLPMTLG